MLGQKGSSKTDTLIKLVLIFFISLLSFSVGTFVGKQFSDSQHRLANLETDFDKEETRDRDTASIPPGELDIKPENALAQEDVEKLSDEYAKTDKDNLADLVAGKEETDHKKEAKKDSSKEHIMKNEGAEKTEMTKEAAVDPKQLKKVQKAADRIANGQEPFEKIVKTEARVPSSLPSTVASSSIGKYTVQVASSQSEEDAKKQAEGLKSKGFSAFIVKADVNGSTWYRVSVGLHSNKKEAEEARKKLLSQGDVKAALVQKIIK